MCKCEKSIPIFWKENKNQELKKSCKKHKIQDVTFVCRNLLELEDWADVSMHIWEAVIPFNAAFSHCRGTGSTKQLAKEACSLQALQICHGWVKVADKMYNPFIQLCISGGNKVGKHRTPYICVPRYNFPIEYCAASAFNVSDAMKRCRENLDKTIGKMDEYCEVMLKRDENEEEDEDEDEIKTNNDAGECIVTSNNDKNREKQYQQISDCMKTALCQIEYCKNCECKKCEITRVDKKTRQLNPGIDKENEQENIAITNLFGKKDVTILSLILDKFNVAIDNLGSEQDQSTRS